MEITSYQDQIVYLKCSQIFSQVVVASKCGSPGQEELCYRHWRVGNHQDNVWPLWNACPAAWQSECLERGTAYQSSPARLPPAQAGSTEHQPGGLLLSSELQGCYRDWCQTPKGLVASLQTFEDPQLSDQWECLLLLALKSICPTPELSIWRKYSFQELFPEAISISPLPE